MKANDGRPTRKIREHHQAILHQLAQMKDTIGHLERGELKSIEDGLKQSSKFLDNELRPHAEWEEDSLYPPIGELLKKYGKPTATMEIDHDDIKTRIDQFRNDVAAFLSLSHAPKGREELGRQLIRNAWQLEAIVSLHLRKEEEVYLSLADSHLTEKDIQAILGGEH